MPLFYLSRSAYALVIASLLTSPFAQAKQADDVREQLIANQEAVTQLEKSLDEVATLATDEDQNDSEVLDVTAMHQAQWSKRQHRIYNRWVKKLAHAQAKAQTRIQNEVARMSDQEVQVQNNQLSENGIAKVSGNSERGTLTASLVANYVRNVPTLAKMIADENGIVPFILHAKGELKQMKDGFAHKSAGIANRAPASDKTFRTVLIVVAVVLCLVFGIVLGPAAIGIVVVFAALIILLNDRAKEERQKRESEMSY